MSGIKKISFLVSLHLIAVIAAIAVAAPVKKPIPHITWQKIPGAIFYLIEIKDDKEKIVLRKQTTGFYYYAELPVGNYQVRITGYKKGNISIGKSTWFDLSIRKAMKPVVKSVSPDKISIRDDSVKIEVIGADFLPDCRVYVKKVNITNQIDPIEVESGSKIVFKFSPAGFKTGKYILLVQNPGGKMSDPKMLTITTDKVPAETNRQKDGLANLRGLYLGIGYHYSYALPEWDNMVQNSYLGFSVILSYTLKSSPRVAKIPFIRNLGFDCIGSYTLYLEKTGGSISDPKLQNVSAGLGIHFASNFNTPLDFILRVNGGLIFSLLKKYQNAVKTKVASSDVFLGGELAIRYPFGNYFFLEIGVDFTNNFYIPKQLRTFNPFIRIGLRF